MSTPKSKKPPLYKSMLNGNQSKPDLSISKIDFTSTNQSQSIILNLNNLTTKTNEI